jgi:uncharacterized protein with GYD domain
LEASVSSNKVFLASKTIRRINMVTYISLVNFTDQGARTMTESTKRADAAKEAGKKFGCDMKEMYWTLGGYDLVAIIDAKDEASFLAFGAALAGAGNVRTHSLRAFTKDEMAAVFAKLG